MAFESLMLLKQWNQQIKIADEPNVGLRVADKMVVMGFDHAEATLAIAAADVIFQAPAAEVMVGIVSVVVAAAE